MQLVRRICSSIIFKGQKQQQQKIASTRYQRPTRHNDNLKPPATVQLTTRAPFSSSATSSLKRLSYPTINFVTRLVLQTIFRVGRRTTDNAQLANASINRALRYSVGSPYKTDRSMNDEVDGGSLPGGDKDNSNPTRIEKDELAGLEDHISGNTLDKLRENYAESRKSGASVWLDFAEKSCYIYLYRGGGEPNKSLAAFDLDGTLIKPKSNKRIPRSATDWDLFSVWTKMKLQQCLRENHARFIIFTNQNGVGLEIVPLEEVQHRIELVTKRLDVPCTVFVAIEKDIFRKPKTGMFQLFNKSFNDSIPVEFSSSFYCGDAIGYPSHSDADIKFAQQLGFPFLTPEKFLRGVKPKLV